MIITPPCPQLSRRFPGGYLTKVLGMGVVPYVVPYVVLYLVALDAVGLRAESAKRTAA